MQETLYKRPIELMDLWLIQTTSSIRKVENINLKEFINNISTLPIESVSDLQNALQETLD